MRKNITLARRFAEPAGVQRLRLQGEPLSATAGVDGLVITGSRLRGEGAAGTNGPVEDAATAETTRSQVWPWPHDGVKLSNGETVSRELVERLTDEGVHAIEQARGDAFVPGRRDDARSLFPETAVADEYQDLPTPPAYERMP